MCFHAQDPGNKTEWLGVRNERWRQRLVRSEDEFLTSTTPTSDIGYAIRRNDIHTTRVLRKSSSLGYALVDYSECATWSLDGE